jgi:predicted peroxiredoxin
MPERSLVIKVTAGKDDPERCNQALADLLAGVLAAGSVTVCTQCAARRNIEADDLISGIRIAGAATFVAEIMTDGAQALVY